VSKKAKQRFVVGTLREVAEFVGMAPQTVKQWRGGSAGMPGKPGHYDLGECVRWLLARCEKRQGGESQASTRLMQVEIERAEIDVAKRRLQFAQLDASALDTEEVARLFERTIAEHNSQAAQAGDRIIALLPDELDAVTRKNVLEGVNRIMDDLRSYLADAAESWSREREAE
jgi:hypothetical protein